MKNEKINLNEKIFIAGASGMAGSAILRSFQKGGYGNLSAGGSIITPSSKELNLLDINQVESFFATKKPTVVVLAAAKVGGILANSTQPAKFILENLKIQTNVIETAWRSGVKRLLFLGSSCIYPKFAKQPIEEESLLKGPLEITNESYAIAKIAGIKLCDSLRIQYGFDAISLMPTNLYGPGDNYHPQNSHVMAALIKRITDATINSEPSIKCWGTGKPFREFMYADDLGEAVLFALKYWNPDADNAPRDTEGKALSFLNVGTGNDISILDLAKKIANLTHYKGEIFWDSNKPDGTPKKQLCVKRLKELGWEAKTDLDTGIKKTIESYKASTKTL